MSRFKVGDKVRCNFNEGVWFERMMPLQDAVGLVLSESERNGSVFVKFGNATYEVPINILELVAPADPKREFLERLQSLLREFGATINISWNEYFDSDNAPCIDMDICFGDGTGVDFKNVLGKFITADNIMDFDKE